MKNYAQVKIEFFVKDWLWTKTFIQEQDYI